MRTSARDESGPEPREADVGVLPKRPRQHLVERERALCHKRPRTERGRGKKRENPMGKTHQSRLRPRNVKMLRRHQRSCVKKRLRLPARAL